ncbi:MAG TPA: anhydro-N-acetylmuramic acid kinase [Planctomycetota bacterium]|nr:anhydro-N-acetylmuramic acid kinase [Planctomycetota bacterium]
MKTLAKLASKRTLRVAGLMSGTSADGVDVAIVEVGPRGVRTKAFATVPYRAALRRDVLKLCDPKTARVDDLCRLNFALGQTFAEALVRVARRNGIPLRSIDLVGSHGQTVCHLPKGRPPSTLQIAEPAVIALRTGITTVADFRPADVAAGGEGAPLVPLTDWMLFRHPTRTRAVQNIGGIANVTYLPAGDAVADVLAFDTGPGNMVIDHVVQLATRGKKTHDVGGRLAAGGEVDERLLARLLRHPFLRRRPPKSTGREQFGAAFAKRLYRRGRKRRLATCDLVASVTAFTACSIADAYRRFLPTMPDEVILSGGGVRNRTLVRMLREALPEADVRSMAAFGVDPDAKEAISFALLAVETLRGRPGNVPASTGAKRPVVLGKIILAG